MENVASSNLWRERESEKVRKGVKLNQRKGVEEIQNTQGKRKKENTKRKDNRET